MYSFLKFGKTGFVGVEEVSILFEILLNIQIVLTNFPSPWWSPTLLYLPTVPDFNFLVPLLCPLCVSDTPFPHSSKMSAVCQSSGLVCSHDCSTLSSPCPSHAGVVSCVFPVPAWSHLRSLGAGSRLLPFPFFCWANCFISLVAGLLVSKTN